MQVPADLQDAGDPGMLRVKAGPGGGGSALLSGGGPLVRAPPRCGRASIPIHYSSQAASSWPPHRTRVSFAVESDSLREQQQA